MSTGLWIIVGVVALIVAASALQVDVRNRRGGTGGGGGLGGGIGGIDEIFAPTRHEALQELELQRELPAPSPAPGDPPWGRLVLDASGAPVLLDLSAEAGELQSDRAAAPNDRDAPPTPRAARP